MTKGHIESLLERGVEAAMSGERERARKTFIRVIELHQRNEEAWQWLSTVVENPADKIVCLENILEINPGNQEAAAELQDLRKWAGETSHKSRLPRLTSAHVEAPTVKDTRDAERVSLPAERPCPHCGFNNPGWAYVCDRCGGELQPVDLEEAVGAGRSRLQSFVTVPEAWLAAFSFDRHWAFLPEIKLATWQRSIMALAMAALFSSAWRTVVSTLPKLLTGSWDMRSDFRLEALCCTVDTPLTILAFTLVWIPLAILTWLGARALGGQRGLKIHAHLIAVALSAWVVLGALLAPLPSLGHYIWSDNKSIALIFEALPLFLGLLMGIAGIIWLTQAIQTAQRLPAPHAVLISLGASALSLIVLYAIDRLTGQHLLALISMTMQMLLLP